MAFNEKRSYTEYTVTEPQDDFQIGFEFNENYQRIVGSLDDKPFDTTGHEITILSDNHVEVKPTIDSGIVRLQRETNIDAPLFDFSGGAIFSPDNLTSNFNHILQSQQEVRDSFTDLENTVIPLVNGLDTALLAAEEAAEAATEAKDLAKTAADRAEVIAQEFADEIAFQRKGGQYGFDADYAKQIGGYPKGAILRLPDGSEVISTVNNNQNDPNSNMTGWSKLPTDKAVDELRDAIAELDKRKPTLKSLGVPVDGTTSSVKKLLAAMNGLISEGIYAIYAEDDDIILIDEQLVLPSKMVLIGSYKSNSKKGVGSRIHVTYGKNPTDPQKEAAIVVNIYSGIEGFYINYPEQVTPDKSTPVDYSWTISTSKVATGSTANTDGVWIKNLFGRNPYRFIDLSNSAQMDVEYIYGQPIYAGILANRIMDMGTIHRCHFWTFYAAVGTGLYNWILNNATAFKFGRVDGIGASSLFCYGYNIGYHFTSLGDGYSWMDLDSIAADATRYSLVCDAANVLNITKASFISTYNTPCIQISGVISKVINLNDITCYGNVTATLGTINADSGSINITNNYLDNYTKNDCGLGLIISDSNKAKVNITGDYIRSRLFGSSNVMINGVPRGSKGRNLLPAADINNFAFNTWSNGKPTGWTLNNVSDGQVVQATNGGVKINLDTADSPRSMYNGYINRYKQGSDWYNFSFDLLAEGINTPASNCRFAIQITNVTGSLLANNIISITDCLPEIGKTYNFSAPVALRYTEDEITNNTLVVRILWTGYGNAKGSITISNLTFTELNRSSGSYINLETSINGDTSYKGRYVGGTYQSYRKVLNPTNFSLLSGDVLTQIAPVKDGVYQTVYTGSEFINR